ncbi:hypothetical protein X943_003134 [Babesia divergens]|uniref:Serine/threonine specific protein phosphatases domain-containing protein n=1 Tax=Babesia divergens TaxID=32595 RepID=A0AAD9LEC2_BABDI|nr:hypothetical protein X943_003134 [Babesia divergens]
MMPGSPGLHRAPSDDFSSSVVTIDKTNSPKFNTMDTFDSEQLMHIGSFGDIYGSGSLDLSSGASRARKASFAQWQSQGNLLMEMKRDDARMRHEARALFGGSSCSDSAGEGEFGGARTGEYPDNTAAYSVSSLHDLFFTSDSKLQPVNNDVVTFLLKTFRTMEDAKLISAPFELTAQIEAFRARIFDVMNKEFSSVNLSEALLTVAFNHFAGHEKPGFMTFGEYTAMMNSYVGVFTNDTVAKLVFDSMDRRRKSAISLNDFIAGMITCSPRATHKANSSAGRLRLQHIFRAYDVKRKGYLNETAMRLMLEHIQQVTRMASSENAESMSNMNAPFNPLRSAESINNKGSERSLDETMEAIMANHENGFGYDAFYTCVNNGTIKDTHLLLRSSKDFPEIIGQHLIHALSHVVVRTEAVTSKDSVSPPIVNHTATTNQNRHSTAEVTPSKSWERSRRPSLWSTSNSPRSPEGKSQSTSPYANIFARDDNPRQVQSARNRTTISEPNVPTSARDNYNGYLLGSGRKPLFQPSGLRGGSLDVPNYLTTQDQLFRKHGQYKGGLEGYGVDSEYTSRPNGDARSPSFSSPLAANRWAEKVEETTHGIDMVQSGFREIQRPENHVNTPPTLCQPTQRGMCQSAPYTQRNSSIDDTNHVSSKTEWKYEHNNSAYLENGVQSISIKDCEGANGSYQVRPGKDCNNTSPTLSAAERSATSSLNINARANRTTETDSTKGKGDQKHDSVTLPETLSTDVEEVGVVRFSGLDDGDLDSILSKRATDLCRRYRARFVGFNSKVLADHGVALKVFTELYMRTFKCNDYQAAFARFPWCSYNEMLELCDVACGVVKQEPCMLKLQGTVQIHGPLNGSVFTLLESFNSLGWPMHGNTSEKPRDQSVNPTQYAKGEATKLLFLGDLISEIEGYSLETLMILFALKALFPYHIFIIRGRREARRRDYKSALFQEIHSKLARKAAFLKLSNDDALLVQSAHELYHRIQDVFENMSISACIEDRVLCLHGSLSKAFRSIEQLEISKPISTSKTNCRTRTGVTGFEGNTHLQHALFGTFSPASEDVEDDWEYPNFTQEEFTSSLRAAGISMLITAGSTTERGYNYLYGERVLQLGGCTPGGIYSAALLKEHRNMHYFLIHRSIQAP